MEWIDLQLPAVHADAEAVASAAPSVHAADHRAHRHNGLPPMQSAHAQAHAQTLSTGITARGIQYEQTGQRQPPSSRRIGVLHFGHVHFITHTSCT